MVTSPSTCSMWVPAVPFSPLPIVLSHTLFNSSHNLKFSTWWSQLSSALTLSHTTLTSTKLIHSHNTLSQVMFYINLYFSYVIYLLCYVITILGIFVFFFFLLVYILLLFARFKKKKNFNIMINDWEYLVEILWLILLQHIGNIFF